MTDQIINLMSVAAVRHFRDMKGGFEIERLSASLLGDYARLCGAVLARAAHVQSCEPAMLAGYLGKGESFANAMARSPSATPTRTTGTTRPCWTPSPMDASWPTSKMLMVCARG